MGRQALLVVLCWLTLSETSGEAVNPGNSLLVNDNVSAESAPRLYRSVPVGVYASAAPYAAFSYRVPAFASGPIASASRNIPAKEHRVFNNVNAYLRDSYGNRFVGTPQTAAYKATIPQQYVQLQALPAHFAEPLAAVAPNYQAKQETPRNVFGSVFRSPFVQSSTNNFAGGSQPFVYAQNVRAWVPSPAGHSQFQRLIASQQQSPSNRALYTQSFPNYHVLNSEPKFQRLEENPAPVKHVVIESNVSQFKEGPSEGDHANLKASPDTQRYTTIVNGKKTVIEVETKPSVPLLDLTLLEPLTFDNPVVPQVQHLLPRINQATYKTLPEFNNEQKNTGSQNHRPKPKKKQKRPTQNDDEVPKQSPVEPTITVKGTHNESPEIFYEINTPNHKETYKEKSVSYNKETNKEPVTYNYEHKEDKKPVSYSYGNIVQEEPVHYSYVSHEPNQNKEAYQNNPTQHLIYKFTPEDQKEEVHEDSNHSRPEDTGSAEVSDEEVHPPHRAEYLEHHQESPNHKSNLRQPEQYHESHVESPNHKIHHTRNEHNAHHEQSSRHKSNHPQSVEYEEHHVEPRHRGESLKHQPHGQKYEEHHENTDRKVHHQVQHKQPLAHKTHQPQRDPQEQQEHFIKQQARQPEHIDYHERHENPPRHNTHQQQRSDHYDHRESPRHNQHKPHSIEYHEHHEKSPRHQEHPRKEAHQIEYKEGPNREEYRHVAHETHKPSPQQYAQPIVSTKLEPELQAITQEYEEDIRLLPTQRPNAAIQVDPNQHIQKTSSNENPHPSHVPQHHQQDYREEQPIHTEPSVPPGPVPIIHETSKRIIIQEETPEEMHSHQEQMLAKMLQEQENNEEDFEKAYKNSALGFPGYNKNSEEIEKDIYNPNSYGVSQDQDYDIDHAQFQEYQAEGDEFPKTARLRYKDVRDDIKSDYFLDYAAHKPESVADRYKKKKEYYKLYEHYKPDKYFADEKKEKQKDKYTLAPSFSYNSEPAKEENKHYFAQYKAAPPKYQYSYSKPKARDNSAFASRPYQSYTSKTHFVEPQFQYGFEPIAIPRLLDSELAAMASNDSPESDKPGMRKKVYKENWYIKKTSTAGGDAAS